MGRERLHQYAQLGADGVSANGTIMSIARYDKYRSSALVSYKDSAGTAWQQSFVLPRNQAALGQTEALRYLPSDPTNAET